MRIPFIHRLAGPSFWVVMLLLDSTPPAAAQLVVIPVFHDDLPAAGDCTLRKQIRNFTGGTFSFDCVADNPLEPNVVVMPNGAPYEWTQGVEIVSTGDQLTISGPPGPTRAVIDLGNLSQFVAVTFGGDLALRNVEVTNGNGGTLSGGALSVFFANLTLESVAIKSSTAPEGGGIFALVGNGNHLRWTDLDVWDSMVIESNPAESAIGGGVLIVAQGNATVDLRKLEFLRNLTEHTGAGGFAQGGALALGVDGTAHAFLKDVVLEENEALASAGSSRAGGLLVGAALDGSVEISGVILRHNSISGADPDCVETRIVAANNSLVTVESQALYSDIAQIGGEIWSCIAINGSAFGMVSGGLFVGDSPSPLAGVASPARASVAGEQGAGTASGMRVELADSATFLAGHLTISGFSGTGLTVTNTGSGTARLENSILWGNGDDLATTGTVSFDPATNRNTIGELGSADPLFVAPLAGDFSLQAGSPARDTGDRTFLSVGPWDLNHASRVAGSETDRGAYEYGAIFGWDGEEGDLLDWSSVVGAP